MDAIELNGKRFVRAEETTVRHDFWLMHRIREAGLDQVRIKSRKREDVDIAVEELIDRVVYSDHALILLGGLFLPEGLNPRDWTPEIAEEITKHLEAMTAKEDKEQIKPLIASMISGFFLSGLASLRTFPASSSPEGQKENEETESQNDSPSILENGISSSENSQGMT